MIMEKINKLSDNEIEIINEHREVVDKATLLGQRDRIEQLLKEFD